MNCRDCGGPRDRANLTVMRRSICSVCWKVRLGVIKAMENGSMTMTDFQDYQRGGLRTKRLEKMGYVKILESARIV